MRFIRLLPLLAAAFLLGGCEEAPNAAQRVVPPLLPVRVNRQFGYIDQTGRIVIQPAYQDARHFYEDRAAVERNGRWGFINMSGKLIVDTVYADVRYFQDGRAAVSKDNRSGYKLIDAEGRSLTDYRYFDIAHFREGLAYVITKDKYGFIDISGELVIPYRYGKAGAVDTRGFPGDGFSEGLCAAQENGRYGYIDRSGDFVIRPQFDRAGDFENGLALVKVDGKRGVINKKGVYTYQPVKAELYLGKSDAEFFFSKKEGDACGVINQKGDIIVPPQSAYEIDSYSDGCFRISVPFGTDKHDYNYGLIDMSGSVIVPPRFEQLSDFYDGLALAAVRDEKYERYRGRYKVGFIDKTGTFVIGQKYDMAEDFMNGIAKVFIGDELSGYPAYYDYFVYLGVNLPEYLGPHVKIGYIFTDGRYLWEPTE